MAQCVAVGPGGELVTSAADPCTSLVVVTPAEYEVMAANPFRLEVEDAGVIAWGVVAVWLAAWAFRQMANAVGRASDVDERN